MGVSKKCLLEWRDEPEKHELATILDRLETLYEHRLLDGGLNKEYAAPLVRSMLDRLEDAEDNADPSGGSAGKKGSGTEIPEDMPEDEAAKQYQNIVRFDSR